MSRIKSYLAIWFAGFLLILYFILWKLTGYEISKFVADILALMGLTFMSIFVMPSALRAFSNGIRTDSDKFIFSYWLIWLVIFCQWSWLILLSFLGRPVNLVQSPVTGLMTTTIAIAAGFGAIAPFNGTFRLNRGEVFLVGIAAGFSGIIAGIALGIYFVSGWVY